MADGIGIGLETASRAGFLRNRFDERDLAEVIAALRFREMHLDRTDLHRLDRIVDRDRGVSIGRRVDDERVELAAALLNPIDNHALVVRLTHLHRRAARLRNALDERDKIRIRPVTINLRLANAEKNANVGSIASAFDGLKI